jgi:CheY-like chemotaxis protein
MSFPSKAVTLASDHPIVMVDDNERDLQVAHLCCARSRVPNPWLSFASGNRFLDFLAEVQRGAAAMPALVLLDINMPGLSGFDVLEAVRKDSTFDELPVFCLLTTSERLEDRTRADTLRAAGFVRKPYELREYVRFFDSLV